MARNPEELIHKGDNDYILPSDSPAGVWIEVENLVVWIRRTQEVIKGFNGPLPGAQGVQIEVYRSNDIELELDSLHVQEVE